MGCRHGDGCGGVEGVATIWDKIEAREMLAMHSFPAACRGSLFCSRWRLWQRRRLVVFNDYVQFAEFSDFSDFWAMLARWAVDKPFEPVAATMRFSVIGSLTGGETCFGDVSQHAILAFHW